MLRQQRVFGAHPSPNDVGPLDLARSDVLVARVIHRSARLCLYIPAHSSVCAVILLRVCLYTGILGEYGGILALSVPLLMLRLCLYTGTVKKTILRVCHCRGTQMSERIKIF